MPEVNVFQLQGEFFEQLEGAAMDSPVFAVVADLYMEFFEKLPLKTAPTKPHLWKRYVDSTYCIAKKNMVEELLTHLNSGRPTISLTVEVEKDGRLPFSTSCSIGEMMAAWTSLSTENQRTQIGTWTFTPTIHPRSRGDCSGVCLTEPQPSPQGRTTCRRKSTISPEY